MLKSRPFEVSLTDKQRLFLPKDAIENFIKNGHKRVKVKASFNSNTIEFYAALIHQKTGAYLLHKKDSVKPDKGCLR